jgi:hypothetical protein
MLVVSFVLLLAINLLQRWSSRAQRAQSSSDSGARGIPLDPVYAR